jgi:hypothetical protein
MKKSYKISGTDLLYDFGGLLERVGSMVKEKYPAMVFPISLLPAPKIEIQLALARDLERFSGDERQQGMIRACLMLLDNFIADEKANEFNARVKAGDYKAIAEAIELQDLIRESS